MRKFVFRICVNVYLAFSLLFSTTISAVPTPYASSTQQQSISKQILTSNVNSPNAISVTSSELGFTGPFSFGFTKDNLNNFIWNAQYTQKFTENLALSGLVEHGSDTNRYGITAGLRVFGSGLLKFSAEKLSQVLPFTFITGGVNQKMTQDAFGAKYQQLLKNDFWQDINIGSYYANTPNKGLSAIETYAAGYAQDNYRNIAGATSKGFDIGSDFALTHSTELNGHFYYDSVYYNNIYSISKNDSTGIGYSLGLSQLLGDHIKISADASKRKIYDTYKLGISWLPPYIAKKLGIELALEGEHFTSHNTTPSSNSVGLRLTFNPGTIGANEVHYLSKQIDLTNDIRMWTSSPAVHMERVLATADEKLVDLRPEIDSITPSSGSTLGGTEVTLVGEEVTGLTSVTFGGIEAPSYTLVDPDTIRVITPPHASGWVDVKIVGPGGTDTKVNGFEYKDTSSNTITVNSINPKAKSLGENSDTDVTITGSNFDKSATVKFGKQDAKIKSITTDKIIATVPTLNSEPGPVDIVVTNSKGESSKLPKAFNYTISNDALTAPANAITMSPTVGVNSGGTTVVVSGGSIGQFSAATTVTIGSKTVALASVAADGTNFTFVTPAGGTGTVNVSTNNPTLSIGTFTYHSATALIITATAGSHCTMSPSGSVVVPRRGSQTFTMGADANYHLDTVVVDSTSITPVPTTYTFSNVVTNHTISNTCAIDTYTITASAGTGGSISPSGAVSVNSGSNQTFTITSNTGYHIAGVTVDGASQGVISSYTFTNVTTTHTISATFAIDTHTITSNAGSNGSISPSGTTTVNYGANQTYTITADTNYHVLDVLVDGASVGTVTSYTFTNVLSNHTIAATFTIDTYTITASAGANGNISPSGAVSVNKGSNQTFLITPNANYHIVDVVVDGSSQGAISSYPFSNVTATHTISAT
ncbi:MAG: IPT/TIG domain-containing protein, partial [Gammaproteobacteria bacterium]